MKWKAHTVGVGGVAVWAVSAYGLNYSSDQPELTTRKISQEQSKMESGWAKEDEREKAGQGLE